MNSLAYASSCFSLKSKTILISGVSRGLGLHLATAISECGANVFALSRSVPLGSVPFNHWTCDIRDTIRFESIARQCYDQTGSIDGYLHVAGISLPSQGNLQSADDFATSIDINLKAAYSCCLAVAKFMQSQNRGSIVVVTSIGAHLGFAGNPGYVASKGGLRLLSKSLAADLGHFNIRVNSLAPGYFPTAMTSASHEDPHLHNERASRTMLGRWGREDELIGPSIFLLSDASSYMTGADLVIDGGWSAKGL